MRAEVADDADVELAEVHEVQLAYRLDPVKDRAKASYLAIDSGMAATITVYANNSGKRDCDAYWVQDSL